MFRLPLIVTTLVAGVIFAGAPVPDDAIAATLSCEAKQIRRNGATLVEGFVTAPSGTVGSYRISVSSPAGDTDQSGEFIANGARTSLGVVPVAGSGAYTADITVKIGGVPRCTNRIGGKI